MDWICSFVVDLFCKLERGQVLFFYSLYVPTVILSINFYAFNSLCLSLPILYFSLWMRVSLSLSLFLLSFFLSISMLLSLFLFYLSSSFISFNFSVCWFPLSSFILISLFSLSLYLSFFLVVPFNFTILHTLSCLCLTLILSFCLCLFARHLLSFLI